MSYRVLPTSTKGRDNIISAQSVNLKFLFRKIIFWLAWYSGAAPVYQYLTKNRQRILCYHSISDHPLSRKLITISTKTFEKQLNYLQNLQLKSYNLQLTFDDGYKDNYINALPILKKHNLEAIVFPTINFIEQGFMPSWINEPSFPALSWDDIRAMHNSGLITFGCHTLSHPNLAELNEAEIINELKLSKQAINHQLSSATSRQSLVTTLAYPFGTKRHFNTKVKNIAKQLAFTRAYTLIEGTNSTKSNPYELNRFIIFDEPVFMFKVRVSGILDDLLNIVLER